MIDLDSQVEYKLVTEHAGRKRGDELDFRCFIHEDKDPSAASWNRHKGIWNCMACGASGRTADLALKLGIVVPTPRSNAELGEIVASYDYRDEEGTLLFQVTRHLPKDFRRRRPDGAGGWIWGTKGIRQVLYRLPELLASPGRIYLSESEKDADNLIRQGVLATSWPAGAVKRNDRTPDVPNAQTWNGSFYNQHLRGRDVVLLPHNDQAGEDACVAIARSLSGTATVRILRLPALPSHGDVSDWLAAGGTIEELDVLADATLPYELPAEASPATGFPRTDAGNGELFAHLYGDRVRYDHKQARWLLWEGHRWAPDRDGEVHRLAKQAARARLKAAVSEDDVRWARQSEGESRMNAMLNRAKVEPPIADTGEGWDVQPLLLGVANGVVELARGTLRAGQREDGITMTTGVEYHPGATCERWLRFLEEVFGGNAELIAFVQRAAGYSLTGLVREQVWFLCHGGGSNGKGTLFNTLARVLGDYGSNTPAATLTAPSALNAGGPSPHISELYGRRVVTCSETDDADKFNSGRIKYLTGGDPLTGRDLNRPMMTFRPQFKLWLQTNTLPRVTDASEGFWRRVRLIPFLRSFIGEARDNGLADTLEAECEGILAWAVAGCLAWRREGLNPPASVLRDTATYRTASDPLAEFITDCCTTGPSSRAGRKTLHEAYRAWGAGQGYSEKDLMGAVTFGRRVSVTYPSIVSNSVRYYRGIGLKSDATQGEFESESDASDASDGNSSYPLQESLSRAYARKQSDATSVTSVAVCLCFERHADGDEGCPGSTEWDDQDGGTHCSVCHPPSAEVIS